MISLWDPSPIIALPCHSVTQSLMLLRLNWFDPDVLRFAYPHFALPAAVRFDSHAVDIGTKQKAMSLMSGKIKPVCWCWNKTNSCSWCQIKKSHDDGTTQKLCCWCRNKAKTMKFDKEFKACWSFSSHINDKCVDWLSQSTQCLAWVCCAFGHGLFEFVKSLFFTG